RPKEHRWRRTIPGGRPGRGPGATDQAALSALPLDQLRERRERTQAVDVASEQPAEQWSHERVGRCVADPATKQRAELFIPLLPARLLHQVTQRVDPSTPRHPVPAPELPRVDGDPERTTGKATEPFVRPDERDAGRRSHELASQAEVPRELDRPRLPSDERIRTRVELEVPDSGRADLAPRLGASFQYHHIHVLRPGDQPVRRGQAGHPSAHDHDASAHAAATSPRCSRTIAARARTNAGSAFGISVLVNSIPTSCATAFASISRSYRTSK